MKQQDIEAGKEYVHFADSNIRIKLLESFVENGKTFWRIKIISGIEKSILFGGNFINERSLNDYFLPV